MRKPKYVGSGDTANLKLVDLVEGDRFYNVHLGMMTYDGIGNWTQMILEVGDKIRYEPYRDCPEDLHENGMVKEIVNEKHIRVVYHCADDWKNYRDYTSALTSTIQLIKGWR